MYTRRVVLLTIALLLCARAGFAQQRQLTIDDLYDPEKRINFSGSITPVRWLSDGQHYLQWNGDAKRGAIGLMKVDAVSGTFQPFHDAAKMAAALTAAGLTENEAKALANLPSYSFNKDETAALLSINGDLYYYDFASGRAARLTNTKEVETDATISPDGKSVGFVREFNIYVVDLASGKERALTTDGNKNRLNGRLDWVYEEELYGRGTTRSYWWSPNSAEVVYLSLDETGVPEFTVIDDLPLYQNKEVINYPKAGQTNPKVRVGVVSAAGGATRWIDLAPYQASEFLVVRVGWTPDSKNVVYEVQNREQTWVDLNLADAQSGKTRTIVREESKAWIEVPELPEWLSDGSFIWRSDREGWNHIYHFAADGKLINPVTRGEWDVRDLLGVSDDGWIYLTANERSFISENIYRVKPDGSAFTRLSQAEGQHIASFNPQFTLFVGTWSDLNTPPQLRLHKNDGSLVRVINENPVPQLAEFKLGKAEFMRVKTRDGFEMEALMIKPPDFDASKKYPVMSYNYSGPGSQSVRNSWGGLTYLWHQMLAQRGYIIWICDNRSASHKGIKSAYPVYRNLGELELRDLEDGIGWLKQQPYVDGSRIGLWGWSYGGYMTAYALTHSKSFKIGISGAPVTDWRNYDTIYTERYMGLPQNNPEGYRKSSVLEAAKDLHGKLLLIHGTLDDNVHMQNTIQLVDALQRAGKSFNLMLYPRSRHGVTHPQRVKHLREMMTQFILENL